MYAIIDIKGKQFKVEKGLELSIPKIDNKIGSKIEFDKPMFVNDNGNISTKSSVKVIAKVLSHEFDKKIIVFKQKRRKGYQKKNGHKQSYTKILIQDLKSTAAKKTTSKKPAAKKTATVKKKDSKE